MKKTTLMEDSLYTGLDKPTSNKFYSKIGFWPGCDSSMIVFEKE
ncbi:GNAT family N-acetyltransferase [Metabacillus arenae]|nr:hypothetical protein [Metabacillus arenae]